MTKCPVAEGVDLLHPELPDSDLAFCWHDKAQILVGSDGWYHLWERR